MTLYGSLTGGFLLGVLLWVCGFIVGHIFGRAKSIEGRPPEDDYIGELGLGGSIYDRKRRDP
jgi:hypothetical protein